MADTRLIMVRWGKNGSAQYYSSLVPVEGEWVHIAGRGRGKVKRTTHLVYPSNTVDMSEQTMVELTLEDWEDWEDIP